MLDQPLTTMEIAEKLKTHLGVTRLKLTAPKGDHGQKLSHIGVRSGGDLASVAATNGCEMYITGEMTHHRVMAHPTAGSGSSRRAHEYRAGLSAHPRVEAQEEAAGSRCVSSADRSRSNGSEYSGRFEHVPVAPPKSRTPCCWNEDARPRRRAAARSRPA